MGTKSTNGRILDGRAKDYARLVAFVEAGVADPARWEEIIERHALRVAWRRFESRYLDGP